MFLALLGCLGFVAVCVLLWFVDPDSRPTAVVGGLFFGGGALVLLVSMVVSSKDVARWRRAMGAAMAVCGAGCALMVWWAITAPETMDGPGLRSASGAVIAGVVGAAFFGGGGLYLLTRPRPRRSRR